MQSIIEKIRKLLRLATSSEPHEAALAMRRARELMNAHQVTEAQLAMAAIKEQKGAAGNYEDPPRYVALLAQVVSELFQCDFYWNTRSQLHWNGRRKYSTVPVFVGIEPNQEICAYCYDLLHRKLVKARREAEFYTYTRRELTIAKDSYALGWVEAVKSKVRELVPPRPVQHVTAADGKGLVAIDPLQAYLDAKKLEEGKTRELPMNHRALHEGYVDGKRVDINPGMRRSDALQLQEG